MGNPGMARLLAFSALQSIERKGDYANSALERVLQDPGISVSDRHLTTELVYGITRRRRTLDTLITRFSRKPALEQPPPLRWILQIGFYQLLFLPRIPIPVAINTSVELAQCQKLGKLTQVVNAILRTYIRSGLDPTTPTGLNLDALVLREQLGILHSFPDWLIDLWLEQIGTAEVQELCRWFNQTPHLDLRVNRWLTTPETVIEAFQQSGIQVDPVAGITGALRLHQHEGDITRLPGFGQGWWSIQDSSAQQVVQMLDPKPGECIIDCCAAPGGKTTHIAELMANQGEVWALDRQPTRLKKVQENAQRLQLTCIHSYAFDLTTNLNTSPNPHLPALGSVDRILLDVPCSGLGTLHRHADARWRQTPEHLKGLLPLQAQLLDHGSQWVKPGGVLVYSTCTLHPAENEAQIEAFLARSPGWRLQTDPITIWPHRQDRDGFFIAKLVRK
jgi:16S rRNA (cytosine967-C5)-methyltransferase